MNRTINIINSYMRHSHLYTLYITSKSIQRVMRIYELHHDFIKKNIMYKWLKYTQQNKIRNRRNSWTKHLHNDDEKLTPPHELLF